MICACVWKCGSVETQKCKGAEVLRLTSAPVHLGTSAPRTAHLALCTLHKYGKYIGIPFLWMGRGYDGCDCIGLAYLFYKDRGVDLPLSDDTGESYSSEYEESPDNRMEGLMLKWGNFRKYPRRGDLLLFGDDKVTHCGINLGDGYFLNQQRRVGYSRIETMGRWFPFYRGAIKISGLSAEFGLRSAEFIPNSPFHTPHFK